MSRARNSLTARFLEDESYTHLLWIDTDLVFAAEHIEALLSHNKDIVCGLYCKKKEGAPELVINALQGEQVALDSGLHQVAYAGTGFMLIKREVFTKMIAAYPEIAYQADETSKPEWDFWTVGVHQGVKRYLSEDWYFCQRCIELGIPVYVDTRVLMKHVGHAQYPLITQQDTLFGRGSGFSTSPTEGEAKASLSDSNLTATKG